MVNYRDGYYTDLALAWVLRTGLTIFSIGLWLLLSGCSTDTKDPRSQSVDLSVRGSYIPGPGASTRNQTPQGGTDEKSDSTPIQPAK